MTALDWELTTGTALRHEEAVELAARERRVRDLRARRRAERAAADPRARRTFWGRWSRRA